MAENWAEFLGWGEDQLGELRAAGYSYVRQGSYAHAITYFEGLAAAFPKQPYERQTLGALYLQIGEYDRALNELDTALALDPDNLPSRVNKAKTLLMMGRIDEGLIIARDLAKHPNTQVNQMAEALVMAYS